jgi:hypothetical protein
VREAADARNKKCGNDCAEAVEDEDSLWKALEKPAKINRRFLGSSYAAASSKKKPNRSWVFSLA